MSEYNYTKAVNLDRLKKEIQESNITIVLTSIALSGTALSIFFAAVLSESEETTLDSLVAAHVNTPLPSESLTVNPNIQIDDEFATITRLKYAPKGWSYQAHCMEIKTSTLTGLFSKDKAGNDVSFGVLKFYQADGSEITSGLQADLDSLCVHTKLIWAPSHNIEIISGSVANFTDTSDDVRLYATAAPHIPAAYGGDKRFIQGGLNFKFLAPKTSIKTDGRASKYIALDTVNSSHLWEFDIKHPAGCKHEFQLVLEFYKA